MNQKKYIFIKEYQGQEGKIPQGTEIIIFRGFVYMNGRNGSPSVSKNIIKYNNK